ncbi:SH3-like domain-containing protein [Algihabitans albus]|uniref:SH3-like domain-containing protein n=1 Tax=Algihabitans albus TaxID=2164067 RepID=UPI000E5C65BD|nr:SH3-like domain-containing protein [Algihabitans albus]
MTAPRFRVGAAVRIRDAEVPGHIRTPFFLRGRYGTVTAIHGAFPNPERLAVGEDGLPPIPLYQVRFPMDALWQGWGAYSATDTLAADIYEHWLEESAT